MERNPYLVSNTTRVLGELELDKEYEAVTKTPYQSVVIRSKKSGNTFEIPLGRIDQIRENKGLTRHLLLESLLKEILISDGKRPL